jgi:hypothetical protein
VPGDGRPDEFLITRLDSKPAGRDLIHAGGDEAERALDALRDLAPRR